MGALSTGVKADINLRFLNGEEPSIEDSMSPARTRRWEFLLNSFTWLEYRERRCAQQSQEPVCDLGVQPTTATKRGRSDSPDTSAPAAKRFRAASPDDTAYMPPHVFEVAREGASRSPSEMSTGRLALPARPPSSARAPSVARSPSSAQASSSAPSLDPAQASPSATSSHYASRDQIYPRRPQSAPGSSTVQLHSMGCRRPCYGPVGSALPAEEPSSKVRQTILIEHNGIDFTMVEETKIKFHAEAGTLRITTFEDGKVQCEFRLPGSKAQTTTTDKGTQTVGTTN